jgi:hypothetical protein
LALSRAGSSPAPSKTLVGRGGQCAGLKNQRWWFDPTTSGTKKRKKMKHEKMNILDVEEGTIFQQVNCMGVMGAGLAKQIKKEYPDVYTGYKDFISSFRKLFEKHFGFYDPELMLGKVVRTQVGERLYVMSMFSQVDFGKGEQKTNYCALYNCLKTSVGEILQHPIYFPYKVGCGLGGGEWLKVEPMISFYYPDAIICRHED